MISAKLKITTSYELKNDLLFYNNTMKFIPLFSMDRSGTWNKDSIIKVKYTFN